MELEVKGCSDCPMLKSMEITFQCKATKLYLEDLDFNEYKKLIPITPSWCPLKIEPIIITLKEN